MPKKKNCFGVKAAFDTRHHHLLMGKSSSILLPQATKINNFDVSKGSNPIKENLVLKV